MDQALETIRNRIDQLGVRETTVAKEGDDEILVQLPGIQDPERAKELIGKTGGAPVQAGRRHAIASPDAMQERPAAG